MGVARQYQADVPSQDPPSGSQGPHCVPGSQPPGRTPLADDQHSPPSSTWPAALVPGVVGATVVVGAAVVAGAAVVVTSQVLAQAPLQHVRPSSHRPTFKL